MNNFSKLFLVYLVVFIAWFIYRYFTTNSELIDEFIAKPLIWLLPLVLIYNQSLFKIGKYFQLPGLGYLLSSVFCGLGLALLQILPLIYSVQNSYFRSPSWVFYLVPFATALIEEVFFRGFILVNLEPKFGKMSSNIITSVLFVMIHLPILALRQDLVFTNLIFGFYTLFVASFLFGLIFLWKRSLWLSVTAHGLNNLLLTLLVLPSK